MRLGVLFLLASAPCFLLSDAVGASETSSATAAVSGTSGTPAAPVATAAVSDRSTTSTAPVADRTVADVSKTSTNVLIRSARQDFEARRFAAASDKLEELLKRNLAPSQLADVYVLLCESKLRQGDFAQAESLVVKAKVPGGVSDEAALERLSFLKAEILYFSGDAKRAIDAYISFLEDNLESRLVNDAVERLLLIDENMGASPMPLAAYARAELAQSAGMPDSALAILETILRDSPTELIADEALAKKADILREQHKFSDALNQYRFVEVRFPQSRLVPECKLKIAKLYATELGEKDKAIVECEEIATGFPNTSYAVEARSLLDRLGKGPGKGEKSARSD